MSSPCGRVAALAFVRATPELELGIELTLQSALRDIEQVRGILRDAIGGLMAEFGHDARREAVVALQFQDLSEQLLVRASRRIETVRAACGAL
jgi:hypothetical protein